MKFIAYCDSPLGKITLAGDEAGLCGLWFEGEKYYAHALAASSADKKRGSADPRAKEQHAASKTQRDFVALKKNDTAAKASSSADVKFCAHTLIASKKFFTRDFAAQDAGEKPRVTNLSAQGGSKKILRERAKRVLLGEKPGRFRSNQALARSIFSGRKPGFTPALNPVGSAFRRAVWEILLKIPYGQTTTYGQIAREIAAARGLAKMSAQAVGGAVGHNEISIIIPCHRVVGTHGSLTGYAGGIDRKIKLLQPGGVDMRGLFTPAKGTAL